MFCVAQEEMFVPFAPPMMRSDEEIFSLAAGVAVASAFAMHTGETTVSGEKPHQGVLSKNRTIAAGATWLKCQKTHWDSGTVWPETVLGPTIYGYDGHGSVRQLFNSSGVMTDTYDYDAFGNLINSTGSTPNNYLFAGEQYDAALGLYYNRARYYNSPTGRFWSVDSREGNQRDPLSLHKYLYAEGDPADHLDPTGHEIDLVDVLVVAAVVMTLSSFADAPTMTRVPPTYQILGQHITRDPSVGHFKEFLLQVTAPLAGIRFTVVQWLQGSYKINGAPAQGLQHQNQSIPFDLPNWEIDSFTSLAEYPGLPGATSLTKEGNNIRLYDAPGAHGALAPGTYEANLRFRVNVYEGGLSHGNDVSSFRSVDDPAPVLSIPWDFQDIYQVPQ
jgi:RHS repeat-associated protein